MERVIGGKMEEDEEWEEDDEEMKKEKILLFSSIAMSETHFRNNIKLLMWLILTV
jgi:hypothetical protein